MKDMSVKKTIIIAGIIMALFYLFLATYDWSWVPPFIEPWE